MIAREDNRDGVDQSDRAEQVIFAGYIASNYVRRQGVPGKSWSEMTPQSVVDQFGGARRLTSRLAWALASPKRPKWAI